VRSVFHGGKLPLSRAHRPSYVLRVNKVNGNEQTKTAAPENPNELPKLAGLLQSIRSEIVADWVKEVLQNLPVARRLPQPLLIDHIPELLDRIGLIIDELIAGRTASVPHEVTNAHTFLRLGAGFDLAEVVHEYAALRATIIHHLWSQQILPQYPNTLRILNQAVDIIVEVSVTQYMRARDRTLAALDLIATASFETKNLDELLRRLLGAFLDTTAAVQTAAIYFRERTIFRTPPAGGLEQGVPQPFAVAIGQGFTGKIAEKREPVFLENASTDPLVKSPILREKRVKALYGLPLVDANEVIGVIHMGSLTAHEFSEEDKQLFNVLACRATVLIVQHMLRERLEAERAQLLTVLEQREQLLANVETERQRFLTLVNNLDRSVVWEADAETRHFTFVSERAHVVTGFAQDEWENESDFWRKHVPTPDYEALFSTFETCRKAGLDCHCDHRFVRRNGTIAWLRTGVHIAQEKGKSTFHGITTDITELKEALKARQQILEIVSHDLRNPLNSITLATRGLEKVEVLGPSSPMIKKLTGVIMRATQQMLRMVADLLDHDALEAQRLSMKRGPEVPGELIQESMHAFEGFAREKQVIVEMVIPEKLPKVDADRQRVVQLMSNLVGNALKATDAGGSIVGRAEDEARRNEVLFAIADTGKGIAEKDLPHLFEPYWRSANAAYVGTGLGLAITKGIVAAHGGRIWAESQLGKGTTFFFTLPIAA